LATIHEEEVMWLLLLWAPSRLQGTGESSTLMQYPTIQANNHPNTCGNNEDSLKHTQQRRIESHFMKIYRGYFLSKE
jgi:hypothetical protein